MPNHTVTANAQTTQNVAQASRPNTHNGNVKAALAQFWTEVAVGSAATIDANAKARALSKAHASQHVLR